MYKDTKLRWELIALIKQICCLLDEPERIAHNDARTIPDFGQRIAEVAVRSVWTEHYHYPTQQEFDRLLEEARSQLLELMAVQIAKHQRWCEEQCQTHWSDTVRHLLKKQSLYLTEVLGKLATEDFEKVVREVLPKRPPIVVLD